MSQIGIVGAGGGTGAVLTLTGNFGVATPVAGNINIVSENTTALFRGAGDTLTQDFLDPFNNIGLGDALVNITTGIQNTSVGYLALTSATSVENVTAVGFNAAANLQSAANFAIAVGADAMSRCVSAGEYNIGIGARALDLLSGSGAHNIGIGGFALLGGNTHISGSDNIAIGYTAGQFITTGISNIAIGTQAIFSNPSNMTGDYNIGIGQNALQDITSGDHNIGIGFNALELLTTQSDNISLGHNSGSLTVGTNNIVIGNVGSTIDNNISIGTTQTTCNIAGIYNTTPGVGYQIVVADNTNKLSTISATTPILAYTYVNTSPYVVLNTDDVLGVDTSVIPITIQLPNAPTTGRSWVVKDLMGTAVADNITVTTVGGVVLIDGMATFVMNSNYESATLFFNGTSYMII